MCITPKDEHDEEQRRGAEHPDLVLTGEEEHPLRLWFPELILEDDSA